MNSKNFTSGLLLGATIVLMVGALLASEKGSDTIKKLADAAKGKFNQLKGDANDIADDAKTKAKDLANKGGNRAKEMLEDGTERWTN